MQLPLMEIVACLGITKSAQLILSNNWQVHLNTRRREKQRSGLITVSYRLAVSRDEGRNFTVHAVYGQGYDDITAKRQALERLLACLQ